jgi:long-chain fatty acid transport protein
MGGGATLRVRLPEAALFDGAEIEGDQADISLDMPWILRAGAELRPDPRVRVEASFVYEGWSIQDELRVTPKDIWIRNVTAIGDYQVGPISIPRNMSDVISVRLGGEVAVDDARKIVVRAGGAFETSSFADEWLTPLTLDSSKLVASLGASVEVTDGVFIDASYGHAFIFDRTVTTSRVPQANPIRPPPVEGAPGTDAPVYVGNGQYDMEADLFGIGLRWQVDPPRPHSSERGAAAIDTETETVEEPVAPDAETAPSRDVAAEGAPETEDGGEVPTPSEDALRSSPGWR